MADLYKYMHSEKTWAKIRKEYLKGSSMQSLHRKYDVSVAAISNRAKKENWNGLSVQVKNKIEQKMVEKLSDEIVDVESAYVNAIKLAVRTIHDEFAAGVVDPKVLRSYVAALKDIKEMGILNIEDQESKIEITLDEALEDYAK